MMNTKINFLFLCFIILLASCEKDNGNKITAPSNFILKNLEEGRIVWNTIYLNLDSEDDSGVSGVILLVDDIPVDTLTGAPWKIEWNTKEHPDGPVSLAIKALDQNGNAYQEITINLVIQNTLMKVEVDEGYFYEDPEGLEITEMLIMLLSEDHEVLGSAIMKNGDSQVFERPSDFDEEFFDLVRGYLITRPDDVNYFRGTVYSYQDMKPGEMSMKVTESSSTRGERIGQCYFKPGNIIQTDYDLLSTGTFRAYGNIWADSARAYLYENIRSAYFYQRSEQNGFYHFIENLEPENTYLIDSDDLSQDMNTHTIALPSTSSENHNLSILAFPTPGNYDYYEGTLILDETFAENSNSTPIFHIPANHEKVKDFRVTVDSRPYEADGATYYFSRYGSLPDEIPKIDASINDFFVYFPYDIDVSVSGTADMQVANIRFRNESGSLSLYLRGKVGDNMRIPLFQDEILNSYNIPEIDYSDYDYSYFSLLDYNDFQDYEEAVGYISGLNKSNSFPINGSEFMEVRIRKDSEFYKKSKDLNDRISAEANRMHNYIAFPDEPRKCLD